MPAEGLPVPPVEIPPPEVPARAAGGIGGVARSRRAQVALITGARVISSLIGVIVPIIVVRVLDPRTFGNYKALFLVSGTALTLLTLGIPASLYYLVPRYPGSSQQLFRRSAWILSAAGVVAGAAIIALAGPMEQWLHAPFRPYAPGLAAFTALSMPAGLLAIAPMIDGRARLTAILLTTTDVIRSLLIVAAALLMRSLGAIIIAAAISAGLGAALAFGYLAWRGRGRDESSESGLLREQLDYALPFAGSSVLGLSRDKLHAYFIAAAFTPVQFAVYAVAILNLPIIGQLTQTVSEVVILETAAPFAEGRLDEVTRVWHRATAGLALMLAPVFICAEVFARDIIVVLFGARYAASAPIFRVYALTILIAVILAPAMFRAMNELRAMIFADFLSLLVSIAVLVVLGRRVGPVAGAVSLVAGVVTFTAVGVWRLAVRLHLTHKTLVAWSSLAACLLIATAAAVTMWLAFGRAIPVVRLLIGGPLAVLAYAALAWRIGLVADSERAVAKRWLDRLGLGRLVAVWPAGRSWR